MGMGIWIWKYSNKTKQTRKHYRHISRLCSRPNRKSIQNKWLYTNRSRKSNKNITRIQSHTIPKKWWKRICNWKQRKRTTRTRKLKKYIKTSIHTKRIRNRRNKKYKRTKSRKTIFNSINERRNNICMGSKRKL